MLMTFYRCAALGVIAVSELIDSANIKAYQENLWQPDYDKKSSMLEC
ncbi:MAG: hypothetical protein ACJAYG_000098 [Oceanicoccus sp.]|jgi:hypothetical protein